MPIYEYFCPHCELKLELLRPVAEVKDPAFCPRCHSPTERLFSAFASFSKGGEGATTPIGGASPCSTCSATSCAACQR